MPNAETLKAELEALRPKVLWAVDEHTESFVVTAVWPHDRQYAAAVFRKDVCAQEMADFVLAQERRSYPGEGKAEPPSKHAEARVQGQPEVWIALGVFLGRALPTLPADPTRYMRVSPKARSVSLPMVPLGRWNWMQDPPAPFEVEVEDVDLKRVIIPTREGDVGFGVGYGPKSRRFVWQAEVLRCEPGPFDPTRVRCEACGCYLHRSALVGRLCSLCAAVEIERLRALEKWARRWERMAGRSLVGRFVRWLVRRGAKG